MKHANSKNSRFSLHHVRHGFSQHAHEYDSHAQLQQSVLFNALREIEPQFSRDMLMLDAGCGTGYLMELLRHNEVPFTLAGCDVALGMCKEARERHSDEHEQLMTCADITQLPYANACFDVAISSLTLQWVAEPDKALKELFRVLKPGGRAIITTFGPMTLQELREAFAKVDDMPHVSQFPNAEALEQQARNSGWQVDNVSTEFRTQHYSGVRQLMAAIRAIGAANRAESRRKSLTGPKRFAAMEAAYCERYETARGIPASWEVIYLTLRKEAA